MTFTSVFLGDLVFTLPVGTFKNCTNLSSVFCGASLTNIAANVFSNCPKMQELCFEGSPPGVASSAFEGATSLVNHYIPGTPGWGSTLGGKPVRPWLPKISVRRGESRPVISVDWARGKEVVIEACSDLGAPFWTPVGTNTVPREYYPANDLAARFYRVRADE